MLEHHLNQIKHPQNLDICPQLYHLYWISIANFLALFLCLNPFCWWPSWFFVASIIFTWISESLGCLLGSVYPIWGSISYLILVFVLGIYLLEYIVVGSVLVVNQLVLLLCSLIRNWIYLYRYSSPSLTSKFLPL